MKGEGQRPGKQRQDRGTIMAAAQIIFGIVMFTSAWWVGDNYQTALYIFGFITVLLGIITSVLLTSRS